MMGLDDGSDLSLLIVVGAAVLFGCVVAALRGLVLLERINDDLESERTVRDAP